MSKPIPHLAYSELTNTVYIVVGRERTAVSEKELRKAVELLDKANEEEKK